MGRFINKGYIKTNALWMPGGLVAVATLRTFAHSQVARYANASKEMGNLLYVLIEDVGRVYHVYEMGAVSTNAEVLKKGGHILMSRIFLPGRSVLLQHKDLNIDIAARVVRKVQSQAAQERDNVNIPNLLLPSKASFYLIGSAENESLLIIPDMDVRAFRRKDRVHVPDFPSAVQRTGSQQVMMTIRDAETSSGFSVHTFNGLNNKNV